MKKLPKIEREKVWMDEFSVKFLKERSNEIPFCASCQASEMPSVISIMTID